MTLTLLIDLDDTLLGNDMATFVPAYLRALAAHLSAHATEDDLISALLSSTQLMAANQLPGRTLKETFDEQFYPKLGWDYENIQPAIDEFYASEFPKLKRVTEYRPEAVRLVQTAFERGCRVAIATNPLFPRVAIDERLRWAGLPPEEYDFAHVTGCESFHFAKPNPAYFAELLAQLGWPEEPVVVIGNDPRNDIQAADCLGLATFWVNGSSPRSEQRPNFNPVSGLGGLDEVIPWLDGFTEEELQPLFNLPPAITAVLQSTPAAIDTLTRALSPSQWSRANGAEEWCLTEVLCHLRDAEREVNLPRLQTLAAQENALVQGVDTDKWALERNYRAQDGPAALDDFIAARRQTLDLLASLSPEDWERPGRHTIFGPTSLQELANFSARHDRLHLNQISRILA